MTFAARLRRGLRSDGIRHAHAAITHGGTYTAGAQTAGTVKSEAPPDRKGLGKGAVGVYGPPADRGRTWVLDRAERMKRSADG